MHACPMHHSQISHTGGHVTEGLLRSDTSNLAHADPDPASFIAQHGAGSK
jgi:hypothetical protein